MSKLNIGVLRGGKSDMYEASLKSGANIIKNLNKESYNVTDVFISDENIWHINGIETTPFDSVLRFDVIFNSLHGKYGSEGNIQHHLETSGVRFTGPGSFSAISAKNRIFMKGNLIKNNIRTPGYLVFESIDDVVPESIKVVTDRFPLPVVVKPNIGDSAISTIVVKNINDLIPSIKKTFEISDKVIIEEFIDGMDVSVGIIDWYRDEFIYALPPGENKPDFVIAMHLDYKVKRELEDIARKVHEIFGLRHYSKIDFILTKKNTIYVIEPDCTPKLDENSFFVKSLESVGFKFPDFLDHIITLTMKQRMRGQMAE